MSNGKMLACHYSSMAHTEALTEIYFRKMEDDFDFDTWWDEAVAASKRGELPTWEMDDIGKHPLFSTELPENLADAPALVAMQELLYGEGETPETIAINFKTHGNEALASGKIDNAIRYYTDAIKQNPSDKKLSSTLFANRAQAYLKQDKFVEASSDARKALQYDKTNFKAAFRGAIASEKLELVSQGIEFVQQGLATDLQNEALNEVFLRLKEKKRLADLSNAARKAKMTTAEKKLAAALEKRRVSVGPCHYQFPGEVGKVSVSNGELTFPMLFLYDEAHQSDWVSGASEHDTIEEHMDRMFNPAPEWVDGSSEVYLKSSNLAFFLEVLASSQATDRTVCFKVKRNQPIGELIKDTRLSGFPIVHVISKKSTAALARFCDENTVVKRVH